MRTSFKIQNQNEKVIILSWEKSKHNTTLSQYSHTLHPLHIFRVIFPQAYHFFRVIDKTFIALTTTILQHFNKVQFDDAFKNNFHIQVNSG